jgi:tetrahydromethanopterin S-methyltransferase subunit D
VARSYTPTALPSVAARALAFIAILLGGLCGGLIGYAITDLQCGTPEAAVELDTNGRPVPGADVPERDPDDAAGCRTVAAVGGLVGAAIGAAGVAVVSVLVLRAMAEWRRELEIDDDADEPGPVRAP